MLSKSNAHRRPSLQPSPDVTGERARGRLARGIVCGIVAALTLAPLPLGAAEPKSDQDVIVDEETTKVIDAGLRFLATQQREDGSWALHDNDHAAALTAYALHAYLATGNLPGEGKYSHTVEKAINFLISCARDDGYIAAQRGQSNMYGHGIATIVLGEVYGQTKDERVHAVLLRAVQCIINAQNPEGGWRYSPAPLDADISATVLQIVALRVARNSGIAVPQEVINSGVNYVKSCYDARQGGFTYQGRGDAVGFARTAAATYSLQVCGLYDDPLVSRGIEFLDDHFDAETEWWTYGNFYAAPAHYMKGGEGWKTWYSRVHRRLLSTVHREGDLAYWQPFDDGNHGVNVGYATSVYLSILALPYGYLPMYQR